jgi:hypothetical protein
LEGDEVVSTVNANRYGIGALEVPTIAGLVTSIAGHATAAAND